MTVTLPRRRPNVAIDVSLAIINVVLLLIFFFLVTGQMETTDGADGLHLAETHDLPLDHLPRPILVVAPSGEWRLDGQPVAPDLLGVALAALPDPGAVLNLLIDRAAPADALIGVLENPALRDRGVRLVTLRREGGA